MVRLREIFAVIVVCWVGATAAWAACPADVDSDGVCDAADACPNTCSGAVVDATGCPLPVFGDFDHDGDVDQDDLNTLNACLSGPAVAMNASPDCQAADFDHDLDVDQADFAAFQRCFSGKDNPASPNCQYPSAFVQDGRLYIIGTAGSDELTLRLNPAATQILLIDFNSDGAPEFGFDRSTFDHIVVGTGDGPDDVNIDESNGIFTDTELTSINGGNGDDTLTGGVGPELLIGGNGSDAIVGKQGNDTALMGAGDDRFIWNPGDGSDTVEGQGGSDLLDFNGSNANEIFDLSANGARARLIRNVGSIIMDLGDVEQVDLHALGGIDNITVRDLTGTGTTTVNLDLAAIAAGNTSDGQVDSITVLATETDDHVAISNSGTTATITGLAAVVNVTGGDAALDQLIVNGLGGNDTLEASNLAAGLLVLTLNGGPGKDHLLGSQGDDFLYGDADDDLVAGNGGSDFADLGAGNDRFDWNPGDGTDIIEGGADSDLIEINGSDDAEQFAITANGTRVRFDRINPAPFFLDINACESLFLHANGGNDTLSCTGNLAALIGITADGGPGNDTLFGGNGADLLIGGDDNDTIDGNQGNDVAFMGAGDDTFIWDPGDGSDTVEGQTGTDTLRFNCSNANEIVDLNANGDRLRLTRNVGSIVMDTNDVERVDLAMLGGTDTVNVNPLTATDVTLLNIALAGTFGGSTGDAQIDNVIVNGTEGDDQLTISGGGTTATFTGLGTTINLTTPEVANDRLTINALGGNDSVTAHDLAAGLIGLTINGGAGKDDLVGSQGVDVLNGEADSDTITSGNGNDIIALGTGDDTFIWNPGDDTDLVDGNEDSDIVQVNGGSGAEDFAITANGTRVRFDRINPAPFFLDIGTCEQLVLNANGGNDTLNCTGNLAALIQITADGGSGDDTLRGGNGADLLIGGDDNDTIDGNQGNDTILMGAGNDTFSWDPGDGSDIVEGQAGSDTLIFNGSNTNEIFNLSANGARLRLTRNVGNIVMDVNDVERVDLRMLGGADTLTVDSLAGTDVTALDLRLASTLGGATGDGQADQIIVNGTSAGDTVTVSANGSTASVLGLFTAVTITTAEPALDRLTINGLAGDDTISASGFPASIIQLTLDGGANDDVLIGSDGTDVLLGGDGDDVLLGGPSVDILDGGPGSNIVIQD